MKKKNIISYMTVVLALIATCIVSVSCNTNKNDTEDNILLKPNEKFNAKIYFISRLNDKPILDKEQDYTVISEFFKKKRTENYWLGIVDRADATYSQENMKNPSLKVAFDADLFTTFAFNKFNGKAIEGSMLYFPQFFKEQKSVKITNECYIRDITLPLKGYNSEQKKDISFDVVFRTGRFASADQVKIFSNSVFSKIKHGRLNMLMIGTIKKDLVEALKTGVNSVDSDFNISIAEGTESSEYCIFLLSYKYIWALKNTTKTTLEKDINLYELNLMW